MLISCEKDVVAPDDKAKGRDELYIEMEGHNYLLRERGKVLYKKQYAQFESVDVNQKPMLLIKGLDSSGYENYKLLLEIHDKKSKNVTGIFYLDISHSKAKDTSFVTDFKEHLHFKNKEIDSIKFTSFKINEIEHESFNGFINFECTFVYSYDSKQIYQAFWKGDLKIEVNN